MEVSMSASRRSQRANMDTEQKRPSILMLPWLAHGHISPYFELAKKLAARNFQIYMCSTPANLVSIEGKLSLDFSSLIRLVELHLPCSPQLPPHYHTTNGLPLRLMATLKEAFDSSANPTFFNILKTLNPNLIVYDFQQPWAPALAGSLGIPAIEFVTFTPSMMSIYHHLCGELPDSSRDFPFPEIYLANHERAELERMKNNDKGRLFECTKRSSKIVLFKTFRELEGKYLDFLEASIGKKMVPVGPLVADGQDHLDSTNELIHWLDEKDPLSTVFVSFGSEYYSSKTELEEIALGLELSVVNFIWVVRFPKGESNGVREALPPGFLERTRGRGIVVEGWAPQMRILKHPSVGGFVSHCGTSSMMESLKLGVPIVAMPMHLDQPVNARLLASLRLCLEVKRDGEGRYCREEISRVIRKVLKEEEGKTLRANVKEMSCLILKKGDEDIEILVKELGELLKEA